MNRIDFEPESASDAFQVSRVRIEVLMQCQRGGIVDAEIEIAHPRAHRGENRPSMLQDAGPQDYENRGSGKRPDQAPRPNRRPLPPLSGPPFLPRSDLHTAIISPPVAKL